MNKSSSALLHASLGCRRILRAGGALHEFNGSVLSVIWVFGSDVSPGLCVSCGCFSASGPVSSCQPVVSTTCAVDCAPPAQLPARLDRSRQLSSLQLCAAAAAVRQQRVPAGLSCPSWPTVGPSAIRSRCSCSLPQVSSARFSYTPLCVGIQLARLARSPSLLAASRQTCLATSSTCVRQGPLLTSAVDAARMVRATHALERT